MQPIERVVRLARRQYGLVTHEQCLRLGMKASTIAERLADGSWRQERVGVYVVGGVPPAWEQTVLAVTLPYEDCWLTHGTGAKLWGLPNAPEIGTIEALRPYGRSLRLAGVTLRRSRIITPADATRHKRIPVTSIGRTIVECAGRLTVAETLKNIDAAVRRDRRHLEATRAAFARLASGGNRRLLAIRAALGLRLPGYDPGESDLELRSLHALTGAGLPMPVQQLPVTLHGKRYRIDLAYPDLKIAIELLGWEWHGGRAAFDADHARANDLVSIGYRLLQFTSAMSDDDLVRWVTDTIELAA
jgi:hypothetical protein